MKTFTKKIAKTVYTEEEFKITKVIHDLPTWMFPYLSHVNIGLRCPICGFQMRMQIGRGIHIETCSMIQVNGFETYPIHKECYDKLEDK